MIKLNIPEEKFSISENNGINLIGNNDLLIYSPGVSTGGIAEMKMAITNPNRKIIATTIDQKGINYAEEMVKKYNFNNQIELKLEDVSKSLPYKENVFDYIYARLVLHYLSKQELDYSLGELYRVLKPKKKLFIVVRSVDCEETSWPDSRYEDSTGFTYATYTDLKTGDKTVAHRYFHSKESITKHLNNAGFSIENLNSYSEQLYADFERKVISPKLDQLIEVISTKPAL